MIKDFSVVLPCHDEEEILEENVEKLVRVLNDIDREWELIIVEDGCEDRTPEIAEKLSEKHPRVSHLHFKEKLGKGKAITEGFEQAENPFLIFMDADLATSLKHIPEILDELEQHDIVIGSRYLEKSESERKITRKLLSKSYNMTVSKFFGTGVKDHQCGFKAFRRDSFTDLKNKIGSNHWFWDTEMIIRAKDMDVDLREMAVNWEEKDDSEVKISQTVIHFTKKIISEKRSD